MSARVSLLALLMACFGLQAPLCAMACASFAPMTTGDGPDRIVADTTTPNHEMPCHGNAEPLPQEQPPSHEDCDCDSLEALAFTEAAHSGQRPSTVAAPVATAAAGELVVLHQRLTRPPDRVPPAPAPDILLMKSTLLI